MANTKLTGLNNGDLAFDLEKIKDYDKPTVKKDEYENEDVVFTIEVNDQSYMYLDKSDRDKDYKLLKKHLSGKLVLLIKTAPFVYFMTDENGTDIQEIATKLIKKGSFSLKDLVETCAYIPSQVIQNKMIVPKNFKSNCSFGNFEVNPKDFILILV